MNALAKKELRLLLEESYDDHELTALADELDMRSVLSPNASHSEQVFKLVDAFCRRDTVGVLLEKVCEDRPARRLRARLIRDALCRDPGQDPVVLDVSRRPSRWRAFTTALLVVLLAPAAVALLPEAFLLNTVRLTTLMGIAPVYVAGVAAAAKAPGTFWLGLASAVGLGTVNALSQPDALLIAGQAGVHGAVMMGVAIAVLAERVATDFSPRREGA